MRIVTGFIVVFVGVFVLLAMSGCLPAAPNDPGAGASATGGGGSGGTAMSGGGGSGGGGATTGGGGSGGGGGTTSAGDMGLASAGDLGGSGGGGDMAIVCDKLQSTASLSVPSGRHNAGQECQGCHAPGGGAPTFYLGGTLYSAASGGTAVAGATINVTDAGGKKLKIISANNGNFWTTTALTFPVTVDASLCPATLPMSATVGGNGACNNCHNSTFRVHVP